MATMLNEEAELESVQPQVEEVQNTTDESEVKEPGLFSTEASLSEAVDSVLNAENELGTTEETVTTEAAEVSADESTVDENKPKIEEDDDKLKADSTVSKPNRELKLLLELSKEANLDTNIPYKRKSLDPHKHIEHQDHRYASVMPGPDAKRSMRSQNPDFVVKHQKFLSKFSADGGEVVSTSSDVEEKVVKEKSQKKIKEYLTIGGAIDEKTRKLLKPVMALVQNNKDGFCWRCHREAINVSCETCPRSYHLKCLRHSNINTENWVCPECVAILNAENTKTRSPALKDMSLDQLCGLLKFALKRMAQCNDSEPFLRPVNEIEFPDYKKYIVQPMDLSRMQRNIRDNLYGSTNAFQADARWLLHNSIIFNSYQSKLTTIAKALFKVCKQEMGEIENCPTCYLNANTKKNWFVEVCPKPHILLWAKLKGFPYWPAKAMSTNSQGMVDVRFFGAHDRAWVPFKECFLYSLKDPNSHKQMKNDIIECVKELEVHIENLKEVYGEFNYAPYRTPYDPENEVQQLQLLLPTYKPAYHTSVPRKFLKIDTLLKKKTIIDRTPSEKQSSKTPDSTSLEKLDKIQVDNKEIEGYGTEEEMEVDGDGDSHVEGRQKSISRRTSSSNARSASMNSQISRRNSDLSIKSDVSRVSNISDKITPVDSTETMEIDLSVDDLHKSSSPEKTPSPDSKKSQEQSALKISDKLMKRLSETGSKEPDSTEKMDITQESRDNMSESFDSLDDTEKSIIESEGRPSRSDINEVILGSPLDGVEVLKVNPNSKSPVETNTDSSEDPSAELLKKIENQLEKSDENLPGLTINKEVEQKDPPTSTETKSPTPPVTPKENETEKNINSDKTNDNQSPADDLLEEMYSESVDASGLSKNEKEINKKKIENKTPADHAIGSNKRKRADENENTEGAPQNKFIKVVDINVIRKLQSGSSLTVRHDNSILKNRLATIKSPSVKETKKTEVKTVQKPVSEKMDATLPTTIEIKSEPNSDAENENDREDIEAKKQYLSALNISEKVKNTPKPAEKEVSRVKTRTDSANSSKAAAAARMSKEMKSSRNTPPINQANKTNQSNQNVQEKKDTLPRLIKQLPPKQRARKSFPRPSNSSPKPIQPTRTESALPKKVTPPPQPKSTQLESQTTNSNLVILTQQPQSVNTLTVLPSNQTLAYTGSMSNPILTMVQTPPFGNFIVPTTALNPVPPLNPISDRMSGSTTVVSQSEASGLALNGLIASAHALFTNATQENANSSSITMNTATCTTTSTVMTPLVSVTAPTSSNVNTITILNGQTTLPTLIGNKTPSTEINEDFSYLSGYVPDSISKSISEMIHRAPPKLKPRPPGPLSNSYDSGLTSAAGRVTSVVNSVAHKLTDYFRGMLIETLNDIGTMGNPESIITSLRLENERLKHKHAEEMLEIKKNVNSILRDIQKSIIDERERVIEETKAACEIETIKRIEEAKGKQWCANCLKEAQFYCCWNTSYCDYPCQLKHWPKHLSKCTQNNSNASSSDNPAMAKLVTPFILRKTAPPKTFTNKPVASSKASKEVIHKASPNSKAASGTLKSPSVNPNASKPPLHLPTSVSLSGSKLLNFNKAKTVSRMGSATSNTSSVVTTSSPKFTITPIKQKVTMDAD